MRPIDVSIHDPSTDGSSRAFMRRAISHDLVSTTTAPQVYNP